MLNTRAVAAEILCRVIRNSQSLTAVLDQVLEDVPKRKDRSFIQALSYGTLRWYYRLELILNQLLKKPFKDKDVDIKMIALIGLFQIGYMRVSSHAAVSETVSASVKKRWATPLLNAVLRTYLRDKERFDALADASDIGTTSHPSWLLQMIRSDWPVKAEEIFRMNNEQAPMVLRVNRLRIGVSKYIDLLEDRGIKALTSGISKEALVLERPVDVNDLPGFDNGWVSVQDLAAQLAAGLLDVKPGHRVLDICAAPGGKTLHLLETCPELSELQAVDIDPRRMQRTHDNLARANLNANLLTADAAQPSQWWDGKAFDRILLDAPCSGTGVIRRHPDIKLLRKSGDIGQLRETQRGVLEAAWPMLTSGGILLYVTCSILSQENERQIDQFLQSHKDVDEWPIDAEWGVQCSRGRQVLTGDSGMDGFYYARLRKS